MKPLSLLSCVILVSAGLRVDLHAAATTTAPNAGYALVEQIIRSCGDEKTFDPSLKKESLNSAEIIIALARLCPAFAEIFPDELAAAAAAPAPAPAAPTTPAAVAALAHTSDDRRALLGIAVAWVTIVAAGFVYLPLAVAIVLQVINMVVDHLFVSDVPRKSIPLRIGGGRARGACVLVSFRECMLEICLVRVDCGACLLPPHRLIMFT